MTNHGARFVKYNSSGGTKRCSTKTQLICLRISHQVISLSHIKTNLCWCYMVALSFMDGLGRNLSKFHAHTYGSFK